MLTKVLEALGALLEDAPVFSKLIEQMKVWGKNQQEARQHLISVLTNVVATFERAHAIMLLELSRLSAVRSVGDYKDVIANKIDRDKFYELFKTNDICQYVHQLHADLKSGFGGIKEAVILGAAQKLSDALGRFEQAEYTLAEQYQGYLSSVLMDALIVQTDDDLKKALNKIVEEQTRLAGELSALTRFKGKIFELSLYN